MFYVFSFSTRNGAIKFGDALKSCGIPAKVINNPIAGSGCTLSVKCDDYAAARGVLNRGRFSTFTGVYSFDGEKYNTIFDS